MRGVLAPQTKLDEVLGLVRFCAGCNEWWPADIEFWLPEKWSGRAVCLACRVEGRRASARRATTRYRERSAGQAA